MKMKMKMNPFFLAFAVGSVLVVLQPLSLAAAAQGTCKTVAGIETTCRAAAGASSSVDYDFCVESLKHVRDANSLDLQGLASASVRLALANAESAEAKVDDLMDLELDPYAREMYRDCLDEYEDASDQLKDALDAINVRMYNKASRLLRSLPDAYGKCGRIFKGLAGVKSPVGELDGYYGKLAGIGLAIVSMVD